MALAALVATATLVTPSLAVEELIANLAYANRDPIIEFTGPAPGSDDRADVTSSGVRVRQGGDVAGVIPGSTNVKMVVSGQGDFEARLDWQVNRLDEPVAGWGQGLLFSVALDDERQTVLQLALLARPGKGTRIRAELLGRFVEEPVQKYFDRPFEDGEFVIARRGDTASFQIVDHAGDGTARELFSLPCPTEDIRKVGAYCTRQKEGNTSADFLLRKLQLTIDSLYAVQAPKQHRFRWWYMLVGGQVLLVAALLLLRQR
ncbi:MAG: hypothetical protein KDB14_04435 [Planctomycetales bacterium]|nr:hypothetical protein [Planctomycetales bacterium]